MSTHVFRDRKDAGQLLAGRLALRGYARPIVLALPPGGLAVGSPIALALRAPLEAIVVGRGAAREGPATPRGAPGAGGPRNPLDGEGSAEGACTLHELELRYRGDRAPLDFVGRTVILVDDGVATGSTLRSALASVRRRNPKRIVVAVPVAPREQFDGVVRESDEIVRLATPGASGAVSDFYEDFRDVTEGEALELLRRAARSDGAP